MKAKVLPSFYRSSPIVVIPSDPYMALSLSSEHCVTSPHILNMYNTLGSLPTGNTKLNYPTNGITMTGWNI